MRILELRTENIKKIKAISLKPEGDVVVIGGENEQGKTSLFDSIRMAIGGAKATPAVPVRQGANEGTVYLDLGDLTVEFVTDGTKRQVVVRNADGKKQDKPQSILDKFYSKIAFDPGEFARMSPLKQAETVKALVGLDFTALDSKRDRLYQERTGIGHGRDDAEARIILYPPSCVTAPDQEIDLAEVSRQFAQAQQHNAKVESAAADWDRASKAVDRLQQELREAQERLLFVQTAMAALGPRINCDQLTTQIAEAEVTNKAVRAKRDRTAAVAAFKAKERAYDQLTVAIAAIDDEKAARMASAPWPIPGLGFDSDGITVDGLPFSQSSKAKRMKVSLAIGAALNPELGVILMEDASLLDKASMDLVREVAREKGLQIWVERVGSADPGAIIIEDGEIANTWSDEA